MGQVMLTAEGEQQPPGIIHISTNTCHSNNLTIPEHLPGLLDHGQDHVAVAVPQQGGAVPTGCLHPKHSLLAGHV